MGFGREARRVRNPELRPGQRSRALSHCLEWSQPVGFKASERYLVDVLGVARAEPDFLAPAFDLLMRERDLYVEVDRRYATLRRRQKLRGLRAPHPDEATPRSPGRWYGDEQRAARYAVRSWLERYPAEDVDPPEAKFAIDVARSLANGAAIPTSDAAALQRSLDWARTRSRASTSETPAEAMRAPRVLDLLGQVYVALRGGPVVGVPWNFVPSPDDPTRSAAAARTYLRAPLGLWRTTRRGGVAQLTDAAADLLVLGHDTPALRELAGLPPDASIYVLEPMISAALDELGIGDLLEIPRERAGLEARLELFLNGELTIRALAQWSFRMIGYEAEGDLYAFVVLDAVCDDWDRSGHDHRVLDPMVRRAARDFLAGRDTSWIDWPWPPT